MGQRQVLRLFIKKDTSSHLSLLCKMQEVQLSPDSRRHLALRPISQTSATQRHLLNVSSSTRPIVFVHTHSAKNFTETAGCCLLSCCSAVYFAHCMLCSWCSAAECHHRVVSWSDVNISRTLTLAGYGGEGFD